MRTKQQRNKTLKGRDNLLLAFIKAKQDYPQWFSPQFEAMNGPHTFNRWINTAIYLYGNTKGIVKR